MERCINIMDFENLRRYKYFRLEKFMSRSPARHKLDNLRVAPYRQQKGNLCMELEIRARSIISFGDLARAVKKADVIHIFRYVSKFDFDLD